MTQADHEREPGHWPARQQQHGGRQQHPDKQHGSTKPEQPPQEKDNLPGRERADHRPPRGGGRPERQESGARGRDRQQQNRGGAPGRSAAVQRRDQQQQQQQSEHPRAPGRPTLGYTELEDINSGSDWEKESEDNLKQIQAQHDNRSKNSQQVGTLHDGSKPSQAPPLPPRQTSEREAGQTNFEQPLHHTGTDTSQKKPDRDDHRDNREREGAKPSSGREPRRGAGRGKGRSEDTRREGRQKERGNQRRPGSRGGPRDGAQAEPRGARTAGDGSSVPASNPVESSSKARSKPPTDKKAESVSAAEHKTAEFEKYDLNCTRIAIVDNIGCHHIDDEPLSPSMDAEFTEVKSKKDKRERHKKEKEEQQKMEEQQKLEEERQRKSQKAQKFPRQAEKPTPVPPTSAWGSGGQKSISDALQGGGTWSTAAASTATTWSSTLSSSNAAPGSHLKAAPITQGWQPSVIPPSSLLPDPLPPPGGGGVSMSASEWGILGGIHATPVFPSTGGGTGSMLDAAVVSKLTEETAQQLGGVTGEERSAHNPASSSGSMPSAIRSDSLDRKGHKRPEGTNREGSGIRVGGGAALKAGAEKEGRGVKEQQQRKDRAESDLTSRKNVNVPPRMQPSRTHQSGPGRGRGAARSAGGGGGDKREKDRAVSGNRSDKVMIVAWWEGWLSMSLFVHVCFRANQFVLVIDLSPYIHVVQYGDCIHLLQKTG